MKLALVAAVFMAFLAWNNAPFSSFCFTHPLLFTAHCSFNFLQGLALALSAEKNSAHPPVRQAVLFAISRVVLVVPQFFIKVPRTLCHGAGALATGEVVGCWSLGVVH
jgi:hypothetical protein